MKNLKEEYYANKAWGLLTSIDLYNCDPQIIRDAEALKRYAKELCELIEMKKFGDTQVVNFGEDEKAGYSMMQLIETSLISGHFANKSNSAYIDIFSCKYYDPSVAVEFTKNYFKSKEVKMHYIFRGKNI